MEINYKQDLIFYSLQKIIQRKKKKKHNATKQKTKKNLT